MFFEEVPSENEDDLPDLPIAFFTQPPEDLEAEYIRFADDFWLLYDYLSSGEGTVAYLSWDGDRPGGADSGYIERFEDRYIFWIWGVDIFEYLGRFTASADAVQAWMDRFLQPHYPPLVSFEAENWIGPLPG